MNLLIKGSVVAFCISLSFVNAQVNAEANKPDAASEIKFKRVDEALAYCKKQKNCILVQFSESENVYAWFQKKNCAVLNSNKSDLCIEKIGQLIQENQLDPKPVAQPASETTTTKAVAEAVATPVPIVVKNDLNSTIGNFTSLLPETYIPRQLQVFAILTAFTLLFFLFYRRQRSKNEKLASKVAQDAKTLAEDFDAKLRRTINEEIKKWNDRQSTLPSGEIKFDLKKLKEPGNMIEHPIEEVPKTEKQASTGIDELVNSHDQNIAAGGTLSPGAVKNSETYGMKKIQPMRQSLKLEDALVKILQYLVEDKSPITQANVVAKIARTARELSIPMPENSSQLVAEFFDHTGSPTAVNVELMAFYIGSNKTEQLVLVFPFPDAGKVGQYMYWFENSEKMRTPAIATQCTRAIINGEGTLIVETKGKLL